MAEEIKERWDSPQESEKRDVNAQLSEEYG